MIDQAILQNLKDIYRQGNISFFLGAGISMKSGLPSWKELVTTMYFRYMAAESWGRLKPYPNYLYAASRHIIKRLDESPDIIIRKLKSGWREYPEMYKEALWDSLYSSRTQNDVIEYYQPDFLPAYIANVIIKDPSRSKVKSVITYNFDDLLEETFQKLDYRNYKTVFESNADIKQGELPVFHVHGYIPFNNNAAKDLYGNIVLGEDDYNNLMNDSNSWVNFVQLTTLTSSVNIMIGLSLTDRNLRRILDITCRQPLNSTTYLFLKRPDRVDFSQEEIDAIDKDARSLLDKWTQAGIKTNFNMPNQVAQILNGIMLNDSENNTRVLKEMKVTPIWVDEYNDIAKYLKEMIA